MIPNNPGPRFREVGGHVSQRTLIIAIVSIAVVLTLILPLTPISRGAVYHSECSTGSEDSSPPIWTPVVILDSPLYGNSTTQVRAATQASDGPPSVWLNETNGSAGGVFELDVWTYGNQTTRWVLGPGLDSRCVSSHFATISENGLEFEVSGLPEHQLLWSLLPNGSSSDVSEPTDFSYLGYVSVQFNASFSTPFEDYQNCPPPSQSWVLGQSFSVHSQSVLLPPNVTHGDGAIGVSLPSLTEFSYYFWGAPRSPGGLYQVAVTPSGGPSFDWLSC